MIKYKKGDVTLLSESGPSVVVHGVNDIGVMGAGVAKAISERYPSVRSGYMDWAIHGYYLLENKNKNVTKIPFQLGQIQVIKISKNLSFCNLVSQRGIKSFYDLPPVRYESICEGLYRLRDYCVNRRIENICMPRIGCGLAQGKWSIVEKIIERVFKSNPELNIIVYDLDYQEGTIYEDNSLTKKVVC
jgi:O-acetyl-ADP-ribose deacetylase (regulator of RNase III)